MEQDFLNMIWVGSWKYDHVTHTPMFFHTRAFAISLLLSFSFPHTFQPHD